LCARGEDLSARGEDLCAGGEDLSARGEQVCRRGERQCLSYESLGDLAALLERTAALLERTGPLLERTGPLLELDVFQGEASAADDDHGFLGLVRLGCILGELREEVEDLVVQQPVRTEQPGPTGPSAPSMDVARPPASRTITRAPPCRAAPAPARPRCRQRLHRPTCVTQKSPNARVRQTVRIRSPNCSPRSASTQPLSDEYERNASDRELTFDTRMGVALISDFPVNAPPSVHAHQRRPSREH